MNRGRPGLVDVLVYLTLTAYFTWPIVSTGSALGIDDWDALLFQHGSVMKAAVEYFQLPFWNPWYCGGNVLWQNPQTPLLTPAYLFALFVSVPFALKLTVAVHYLAGFVGMDLLLRRGLGVAPGVWIWFLAATFTLGGGAALHMAVGHMTFLAYFHLPWLLWSFISALSSRSFTPAIASAAILALGIWNGGVYIVAMAAVALGIFACMAALCRRSWRPLATLAFVGLLSPLLCAPKLVPALLFAANPHKVDIRYSPPGRDVMSVEMLKTSLLEPFQFRRLALRGMKYGWHEYGNFIGAVGVFLIVAAGLRVLIGLRVQDRWLGVSLAVTTVLLLLVAIGDFGSLAPYSILRRLPVLSDLRIPARYLLIFTVFGLATVGWAAARGGDDLSLTRSSPLLTIALGAAALFLAYCNRTLVMAAFPYAPAAQSLRFGARPPAPAIDASTDGFAPDSPMYRGLMANRAVLRCNEPLHLPGQVDAGRPLLFVDGGATLSGLRFSPNRVDFALTTQAAPVRVYMNQRYVAGWHSSAGPIALDPGNQLPYVTVPAFAAGQYSLTFVPKGLVTGVAAGILGLVLAAVFWTRHL